MANLAKFVQAVTHFLQTLPIFIVFALLRFSITVFGIFPFIDNDSRYGQETLRERKGWPHCFSEWGLQSECARSIYVYINLETGWDKESTISPFLCWELIATVAITSAPFIPFKTRLLPTRTCWQFQQKNIYDSPNMIKANNYSPKGKCFF